MSGQGQNTSRGQTNKHKPKQNKKREREQKRIRMHVGYEERERLASDPGTCAKTESCYLQMDEHVAVGGCRQKILSLYSQNHHTQQIYHLPKQPMPAQDKNRKIEQRIMSKYSVTGQVLLPQVCKYW